MAGPQRSRDSVRDRRLRDQQFLGLLPQLSAPPLRGGTPVGHRSTEQGHAPCHPPAAFEDARLEPPHWFALGELCADGGIGMFRS